MSAYLDISTDCIQINRIEKGSVKVTIKLPTPPAERLENAFKERDPQLYKFLDAFVIIDISLQMKDVASEVIKQKRGIAQADHVITNDWASFADQVLSHLNNLKKLQGLHLTSIAKAIEVTLKDNIKIIFRGEPEGVDGEDFTGVTMSQECQVYRPGCAEAALLTEHFIFYSESRDPSEIRFYVAHELGHILMHHPMEQHDRESIGIEGHDEADFYVLRFTEDEEVEADLFAAILIEQRPSPKPPRPTEFVCPSKRTLGELKRKGLLNKKFASLIPD